jgi:branched-chain amino acid transport system ATP-binding protein
VLLKVERLHVRYGTFEALRGVSLQVAAGEVVTLLGANGAGKSTLLRTISGLLWPAQGSISYGDLRIDRKAPDAIVRLGVSHCPEGRMLFPEMAVQKNLDLGAYVRRRDRALVERLRDEVYRLFPKVRERRKQAAATLSGGEQQMVAIGRALMSDPRLLLLDEPSLGLAPLVVMQIMDALVEIKKRGTAILLVEQNAAESLRIADRGYVLEMGHVLLTGTGEELTHDPTVKHLYLGT